MRVSEISEQCGPSPNTLRYYERIGLLPPIHRNNYGTRDYSDLDVRRVEFIKCMRSVGLPIEVLIEYFKLVQGGDQTIEAQKVILIEREAQLFGKMEEMKKTLNFLDYKITAYEDVVLKGENEMVLLED